MKKQRSSPGRPRVKLPDLTGRLREKSRKITGPRQAILDILRQHSHPLTNKEVFSLLPEDGGDLATVYRSMHLLENMGMVKRFDFGDGVARFELICAGDDGHHHHLICTRCSIVIEIEECFPRDWEERIATQNGFETITHKLEFFGVCSQCRESLKRPR